MTNLAEILAGVEAALELEKELGVRTVECDRALLAPLPPPAAVAPPFERETPPLGEAASRRFAPPPAAVVPPFERETPSLGEAASRRFAPSPAAAAPPFDRETPSLGEAASRRFAPPPAAAPRSIFFVADTAAQYAGAEGALFDKMLAAIGCARGGVTLATSDVGRQAVADWVARARPACVFVLGSEAMHALFPHGGATRGSVALFGGVPAFVAYSPKFILQLERIKSATTQSAKRETWNLLKRAKALASGDVKA